jgi:pimeloyl-ACP methyl ester carboxylesterase
MLLGTMLRHVLGPAAAGVDAAMRRVLLGRSGAARRRSPTESLTPAERLVALAELRALYGEPVAHGPDPFFPEPPAITPSRCPAGTRTGAGPVDVVDLRWDSGFEPFVAAAAARYRDVRENQLGAARLFLHRGPRRPLVLLVHGYRAGHYALEERLWPVSWLLGKGLDVGLFVLPFHGVRARPGGPPRFPASDPRLTNEGFRHAISDLRALVAHALAEGAPAVGAMGMSLGGYTTALAATLEPRLAFAVPFIPLASLADVAKHGGRLVGTPEEQAAQHRALDAVHQVVSPFERPPQLGPERVLVGAGDADRITPRSHAERIAAHFGAPLVTFHGGHLLQFGRSAVFREVGKLLGRLGLFPTATP